MPGSAIFKYAVLGLKCQQEGKAKVMTFQPSDITFEYGMNRCALSVLSYDKLQKLKKTNLKNNGLGNTNRL